MTLINRDVDSFQASKPLANEEIVYTQYKRQDPIVSISKDVLVAVKNKLDAEIIGHDGIKKLILRIMKAGINKPALKKMHLLLNGAPATSKTVFIKTIFDAIGAERCIFYDASMSSQVGLLDHLISYDTKLANVRYICLDELDKMKKAYQFGVLNALELGVMKETKFRRHREVNLKNITFFATSNTLDTIIDPLKTRLMIYNVDPYTPQQFNEIAFRILTGKYKYNTAFANNIIRVINEQIPERTIRTVVQFATLIDHESDIAELVQIFKHNSQNFY